MAATPRKHAGTSTSTTTTTTSITTPELISVPSKNDTMNFGNFRRRRVQSNPRLDRHSSNSSDGSNSSPHDHDSNSNNHRRRLILLSISLLGFMMGYLWYDAAKRVTDIRAANNHRHRVGRRQQQQKQQPKQQQTEKNGLKHNVKWNDNSKSTRINTQLKDKISELEQERTLRKNGSNGSNGSLQLSQGKFAQSEQPFIRTSSMDKVIDYLMNLADTLPEELWTIFGKDGLEEHSYGEDPFLLSYLENGQCPWSTNDAGNDKLNNDGHSELTVDWLPPRPRNSKEISADYKSFMQSVHDINHSQDDDHTSKLLRHNNSNNSDNSNKVILWYEHISKAGGTTFCGLAQTNMPQSFVPRYHCMPRKGQLQDGRVGSWGNEELENYTRLNPHRVVSNEWDPFNLDKLALSGRSIDGIDGVHGVNGVDGNGASNQRRQASAASLPPSSSPRLLFLTTLRDPSDRLVSAYTFFGIPDKKKQPNKPPPTFEEFTRNNILRTKNYRVGEKSGFRSNTARWNHIVWRFSGGSLPALIDDQSDQNDKSDYYRVGNRLRKLQRKYDPLPPPVMDPTQWHLPFRTAVQTLSQQDLILPMDYMTKPEGKRALQSLLGWETFEITSGRYGGEGELGQVVTKGGVRNSKAREYLSEGRYRVVWEGNWLDNILVAWSRAVFFARLHCEDWIVEDD